MPKYPNNSANSAKMIDNPSCLINEFIIKLPLVVANSQPIIQLQAHIRSFHLKLPPNRQLTLTNFRIAPAKYSMMTPYYSNVLIQELS